MIEVIIRHKGSEQELARIDIENIGGDDLEEAADYSVRFAVNKGDIGLHQRGIFNFPRRRYNVLALLLQALNTLEPRDLEFVGEWDNRPKLKKLKSRRDWF